MKITEHIDRIVEHPRVVPTRRRDQFYASDASLKIMNLWGEQETIGSCLRKQWYRITGTGIAKHFNPEDTRRRDYGSTIHEYEIGRLAKAQVLVESEVSFYDAGNNISGRVDAFIRNPFSETDPPEIVGWEAKTVGISPNRGLFRPSSAGAYEPMPHHVLQTMVYAKYYHAGVKTWLIVYFGRAGGEIGEHVVTLTDNGVSVNGEERDWKVEGIYARWRLLHDFINAGEPPPRDYEIAYNRHKLELMLQRQQLGRKQAMAVKSGQPLHIGSWQCRMCRYRVECWGDKGNVDG